MCEIGLFSDTAVAEFTGFAGHINHVSAGNYGQHDGAEHHEQQRPSASFNRQHCAGYSGEARAAADHYRAAKARGASGRCGRTDTIPALAFG